MMKMMRAVCALLAFLIFNAEGLRTNRYVTSKRISQILFSGNLLESQNLYSMPSKLSELVCALRTISDDKLRYQQLLFFATRCPPMPNELKIPSNKVPGCLSTVHVHATLTENNTVKFQGDSDAQLTKGLVSLLLEGLSDSTPDEIAQIQPEFIQYAGIGTSLTPGRNNGFLNMLKVMKFKAKELKMQRTENSEQTNKILLKESSDGNDVGGPIYRAITSKLRMLKPSVLEIIDESHKHAGHAGVSDIPTEGGETHFNVKVIAACFQGLTLVQRHKMIYTLLANEMNNGIHALSIYAKTPQEEQEK